jgi:hypothetical protein
MFVLGIYKIPTPKSVVFILAVSTLIVFIVQTNPNNEGLYFLILCKLTPKSVVFIFAVSTLYVHIFQTKFSK